MKKWKSSSDMNNMILENGSSYLIKPKFKKSIWEIEFFNDTKSKTSIKKSLWRSGLFEVRISSIKEIEILHINTNLNQNSNDFLCSNDFKEFQSETFDCCEEIVEKEIEWDLDEINTSLISKAPVCGTSSSSIIKVCSCRPSSVALVKELMFIITVLFPVCAVSSIAAMVT